jgi:hypothetical protein
MPNPNRQKYLLVGHNLEKHKRLVRTEITHIKGVEVALVKARATLQSKLRAVGTAIQVQGSYSVGGGRVQAGPILERDELIAWVVDEWGIPGEDLK